MVSRGMQGAGGNRSTDGNPAQVDPSKPVRIVGRVGQDHRRLNVPLSLLSEGVGVDPNMRVGRSALALQPVFVRLTIPARDPNLEIGRLRRQVVHFANYRGRRRSPDVPWGSTRRNSRESAFLRGVESYRSGRTVLANFLEVRSTHGIVLSSARAAM